MIPVPIASWTGVGTAVSAAGGGVAAVAGCVAVFYARKTVKESDDALVESKRQHGEQIAEMKREVSASAAQHEAEMEDRSRIFATEQRARQLEQIDRTASILLDVAHAALLELDKETPRTRSRLPVLASRLYSSIAPLYGYALPYPPGAKALVDFIGTNPPLDQIAFNARGALDELVQWTNNLMADEFTEADIGKEKLPSWPNWARPRPLRIPPNTDPIDTSRDDGAPADDEPTGAT